MTREEAEACRELLSRPIGEPDRRRWGDQFVELTRVLRKGAPAEVAERLHRLYRLPVPLPDTHQLMIVRYEDQLLPELARALGEPVGALKAALHRGHPAFASESPYRPPQPLPPRPASLGDWSEAPGFHVYGAGLVLGESPHSGGDSLFRQALNGAWLVLHREQEDKSVLWVAVHAGHAVELGPLLEEAAELGEVMVEGGTCAAVDAEVRDDPWYRRDLEAGEPQGRGFIVQLWGDGPCAWSGAFAGDRLCLVATLV